MNDVRQGMIAGGGSHVKPENLILPRSWQTVYCVGYLSVDSITTSQGLRDGATYETLRAIRAVVRVDFRNH